MNYNHLHYFYMVVRHGSISAASRSLSVSQPSLSSQIRTFEENLGASLFDRRGNRLELTPIGKKVYQSAAQMFEISDTILTVINQSPHQSLPMRIGIADEIERPFAVNLVKSFATKWKENESPYISFVSGVNDDLIGKLRSWTVDAVITNRPSAFEDLEAAGTLVLPIFLAVAGNPDLSNKSALACSTKDIPKILVGLEKSLCLPSSRLKLREEIDSFLSADRQSYAVSFESDTIATIVRAIIDNVGVGFVPQAYVFREVTKGEITIFGPKEGLWRHSLFLMIKRGRTDVSGVSEIIQAFEDLKSQVLANSDKIQPTSGLETFLKQLRRK